MFDCAAKYHGVSLNDNVLQGPYLTNNLIGVLCRFRQYPVALIADMEAMIHQVCVNLEDVNALRFLRWPNGNFSSQPVDYQMLVHLFGGLWSPSCSKFALKKTAEDNAYDFNDEVVFTAKRNFYVNDLKSLRTSQDAIKMQRELRMMLLQGGLHLTKWISNRKEVLNAIPENEMSKELKNINLEDDALSSERAFGLHWDVE